jgi:hypothetical protein
MTAAAGACHVRMTAAGAASYAWGQFVLLCAVLAADVLFCTCVESANGSAAASNALKLGTQSRGWLWLP